MKKDLRFYFTIVLTRMLMLGMRLIGRNSTYFPGVFALKLCPNFLKQISKPKLVIAVTGTNGKTTTTNLIYDMLKNLGVDPVCNLEGSNMAEGQISTLLKNGTTFWGRSNKSVGLFEIDERSSERIYSALKPNYLVVTNLFRDTIRREGNPDFIFDLLDKTIPKETTLILNADDIISSNLAKSSSRVYYGIAPLEGEKEEAMPLVTDAVYDFESKKRYEYVFRRYHHIGIIKDFSPACDYRITEFQRQNGLITVNNRGSEEVYKLISHNITDFYNELAAISLLRELDYSRDEINLALEKIKIPESRFRTLEVEGKKIIFMLSKGSNSIASSRVVDFIAHQLKGTSSVFLANDEVAYNGLYNGWFYEIDYRPFQRENIIQVLAGGLYPKDFHLALLLQGVDEKKILSQQGYAEVVELINLSADNIVVTYDLDGMAYLDSIENALVQRIKIETKIRDLREGA